MTKDYQLLNRKYFETCVLSCTYLCAFGSDPSLAKSHIDSLITVKSLSLSFYLLRDKDYDATILLDKMMLLQRDFDTAAPLRRLSTVSSVQDPDNIMATQWIWYWKDEYGTWRKYDVDHVVSCYIRSK